MIRELNKLLEWRGKPEKIRSDNGPEFVSEPIAEWCESLGIEWEYIQPGKPTQNSLIERFNRTAYSGESGHSVLRKADTYSQLKFCIN